MDMTYYKVSRCYGDFPLRWMIYRYIPGWRWMPVDASFTLWGAKRSIRSRSKRSKIHTSWTSDDGDKMFVIESRH